MTWWSLALGAALGLVWWLGECAWRRQQWQRQLDAYQRGYRDGWEDCGKIRAALQPGDVVVTNPHRR